jgi:hypothetical protein
MRVYACVRAYACVHGMSMRVCVCVSVCVCARVCALLPHRRCSNMHSAVLEQALLKQACIACWEDEGGRVLSETPLTG